MADQARTISLAHQLADAHACIAKIGAERARLVEIIRTARQLVRDAEGVASYAEDLSNDDGDVLVPRYRLAMLRDNINAIKVAEAEAATDDEHRSK